MCQSCLNKAGGGYVCLKYLLKNRAFHSVRKCRHLVVFLATYTFGYESNMVGNIKFDYEKSNIINLYL